ncbi:MAG: hypothetical protein ACOC5T_00525 [Elusimicrobiota bacterium]
MCEECMLCKEYGLSEPGIALYVSKKKWRYFAGIIIEAHVYYCAECYSQLTDKEQQEFEKIT